MIKYNLIIKTTPYIIYTQTFQNSIQKFNSISYTHITYTYIIIYTLLYITPIPYIYPHIPNTPRIPLYSIHRENTVI